MQSKKGLTVLSLFDGMSCGLQALKQAGIPVANYFASEIDKYAIQIAKKNHPEINHLGSIENWEHWGLPKIDLIIAGPPCQGFSIAGKGLNWEDPRSQLFLTAIKILRRRKPKYFLFENVASMKKEIVKELDELLGVKSIMINSALVSAQNRKRNYWCNWDVEQPEDKGILLKDVIDGVGYLKNRGEWKEKSDKSQCLDANYFKGVDNHAQRTMILELQNINPRVEGISVDENGIRPHRNDKRKSGISELGRIYFEDAKKTYTVISSHVPKVFSAARRGRGDEIRKDSKANALLSDGHQSRWLAENEKLYRKLTPTECERLQTLPDSYTEVIDSYYYYLYITQKLINNEVITCQKNVQLKDAAEILKPLNMGNSVFYITKDLKHMVKSNCQKFIASQKKNVNIVIEKLAKKEVVQEECVISIIKIGLDTMTLYIPTKSKKDLDQEDTKSELMVRMSTGKLWRIILEENSQGVKRFIISILIKLITELKIFTYVRDRLSIHFCIDNLNQSEGNLLKVELSGLRMESILLCSNTQRYKMIGNGWTVSVIEHILNGLNLKS